MQQHANCCVMIDFKITFPDISNALVSGNIYFVGIVSIQKYFG